jgi:hypothetical protein
LAALCIVNETGYRVCQSTLPLAASSALITSFSP